MGNSGHFMKGLNFFLYKGISLFGKESHFSGGGEAGKKGGDRKRQEVEGGKRRGREGGGRRVGAA